MHAYIINKVKEAFKTTLVNYGKSVVFESWIFVSYCQFGTSMKSLGLF